MSTDLKLLFILCLFATLAIGVMVYPLRKHRMGLIVCVPLFMVLLAGAYWQWGAWPALRHYQQQLAEQQRVQAMLKTFHGPQELIDKLTARLRADPQSARGWYLLGRLYAGQNQWHEAHAAFKRAHDLQPNNAQITVNYVQSLIELNHRHFNAQSRTLLRAVLDKNPQQPDALALLAMDAYEQHAYEQAIQYWQRLLALVPTQSEEGRALRQAIAKAQKKIKSYPRQANPK